MNTPYRIDFRRPQNINDLALYLGISSDLLQEVVASGSRSEFYFRHLIPKRSRHRRDEFRVVWQTGKLEYIPLVDAHKAFARRFEIFARLADARFPHPAAFGYIRHRGTRDNAAVHSGARNLMRADIKEFFPSISAKRLEERFVQLGMHKIAARGLSRFATIDSALPLGLNASPMLANVVCVDMDEEITKLAGRFACQYTRYADDISISGEALPLRSDLEELLVRFGFQLNGEKFRITKRGQSHYVTGLSISDPNGPHVPKRMKRVLRQELYYSRKHGVEDHLLRIGYEAHRVQSGVNRLDGIVRYVSYIEGGQISEQTKALWAELLARDDLSPSYPSIENRTIRHVLCFVDECEIAFRGVRYLALALAVTQDPNAIAASTIATLRQHQIEDPFYAGDRAALDKKGLHFVDAHPDLRTAYVKTLAHLPVRAYLGYAKILEEDGYEETYTTILSKLLLRRLIRYDRAFFDIHCEQNSKVSAASIGRAVRGVYELLESIKSRRPITEPRVLVESKKEQPCFSAPDFFLGVFGRFAQIYEKPNEPIRAHQFERLRDKFGSILDCDTEVEYSRRRVFTPWPI